MALKTYSISQDVTAGSVNQDKLHTEISDSGYVNGYDGLQVEDDALRIFGVSFNNETACDDLIANHDPEDLDDYKKKKHLQIDLKTMGLIDAGFTYDSQTFSLSTNAQLNWVGLKSLESLMTWPVKVSTKDNGEYTLLQANLDAFVQAGKDVLQGHLDSGRALKVQVNSAVDKAGVDAVVDNR